MYVVVVAFFSILFHRYILVPFATVLFAQYISLSFTGALHNGVTEPVGLSYT